MAVEHFLFWLQGTPLAHLISKSHHLVGAGLQVLHIAGFVSLLAAVVLLALRGFGLVFPGLPAERLKREMARFLWAGLALTIASGLLMFITAPLLYFNNRAFDVKMGLLVVAIVVQLLLFRYARTTGSGRRAAVFAATVSLVLWFGVGVAGRAIGFL